MTFTEIQAEMQRILKPSRYTHTVGVVYTAASLAMRYGEDIDKSMLASLLHDASKSESRDVYIQRAKEYGIVPSAYEISSPELLHCKLSAYMAKNFYGVYDEDVLRAITFHTTGRPGMSLLEKIVYTADFIEPGRTNLPGLDLARKLAFEDIDRAIAMIAKNTIDYINGCGYVLDPLTVDTYNFYKKED